MILITGASGFIGKHLLDELVSVYGREHILALTSNPLKGCPYLLHHNYNFSKNYFVESGYANIETIIHAGAFTPKSGQQANNIDECNTNIFNTSLLLSSNLPELKKIIYLSTLDIYGNDDVISENTKVEPVSLYGDSKLYCEKLVMRWAQSNNSIAQILRIGHVYGPGEEAYQKIIPITIQKLLKKQPLQIWGSGKELRSFIYIKDVIKAIISSLTLDESIGAVNVVSAHKVSMESLVEKLITISGEKPEIEYIANSAVARDLVFDNTKMKTFLLQDELPLTDGLAIEWEYMKGKSI